MAHIVRMNQNDVVVDKVGESYLLVFQRRVTVGNGTILTSYQNEDSAIAAAEKFPRMYELAQQAGYSLSGNEFVNTNGRRVHVSIALNPDTSETYFLEML